MKRVAGWSLIVLTLLATAAGCWTVVAATLAFNEAGRWLERATYITECAPGDLGAGSPGCSQLAHATPHWPFGVEVTDPSLIATQGGLIHATGSAVLTHGGLMFAVAGILLSLGVLVLSRARNARPA